MNALVQTHGCTGVLVKENVVVVPAQCVYKDHRGADAFPLVRLGSYDLNSHDGQNPEEVRWLVVLHLDRRRKLAHVWLGFKRHRLLFQQMPKVHVPI